MQRRPNGSPPSKRRKIPYDKSPKRKTTTYSPAINTVSKFQPSSGTEKKYIDTTVTSCFPATTVTTWGISLLNGVSQGLTMNARVGNKIQMKSIQLRLVTPAYVNDLTRIRVIYDKNTNGATPAVGAIILEQDDNTAMIEKNTAGRFITLCDEYIDHSESAATNYMEWHKYIKCDLPVVYQADGATVSVINAGGLFLMINHGGATFATQAIASYARVRFTDE